MGGRGSSSGLQGTSSKANAQSTQNGVKFNDVVQAQRAANDEGLFEFVSFMKYDFSDPNDLGTPVIDVKTANEIYNTIHKIATEFPELKGIARNLGPNTDDKMPDNTYAWCYMRSGRIEFNPKKFNSWDKLQERYQRDLKSGWHPANTDAKAIIAHEFGHAIDGWLSYQKNLFGYTPGGNVKKASSAIRAKVMKAAGLKVRDVGKNVSRYATTDAAEWFAESFSEYVCSPNPRPVAAAFGRELRKLIKQASKK